MRTFGTILALLLIFFGLVVAGLLVVRLWQGNDFLGWNNPAPTPTPDLLLVASGAGSTGATGADGGQGAAGELGTAGEADMQRLFVGVESGGMPLGDPQAAPAPALPADDPQMPAPLPEVLPPLVECPPQPAEGFAADSAVVTIGMLRVYSQADVASPALAELQAGQGLWIVAGEDGSTAVKRCEIIWHRVRTAGGIVGWALDDAIDVVVPTIMPLPTAAPTAGPTPVPPGGMTPPGGSICPGGCPQGGCVQPCPTPCFPVVCPTPCVQPCVQQPCTSPCGVFPK
jgi:hypothetical protein